MAIPARWTAIATISPIAYLEPISSATTTTTVRDRIAVKPVFASTRRSMAAIART